MGSVAPRLSSSVVPQADNPATLVRAWRMVAARKQCDATTLQVHPRQVAYYRSALQILGLGHGSAPPSDHDVVAEDAIATLKGRFETSECGSAWLRWSGVSRLEDVDPSTALRFLEAQSDLSGTTLERRAGTLRRWHAWMTGDAAPVPEASPPEEDEEVEDELDGSTSALGHYEPTRSKMSHWSHWTYDDWNDRLVEHILGNAEDSDEPVTRIAATPEELARIAGADPSEAAAIALAFVARVVDQLPSRRRSFCGFCLADHGWEPRSSEPPHFFAMLWFTCLIAYGYPTGEGAFFERFRAVLGKADNCRSAAGACLPGLWEQMASWAKFRRRAGDRVRLLELPPRTEHREVIGYSHFLAFPNRADRNALAVLLWRAGLVGFEPPLKPVLAALNHGRKDFSRDFVEDFRAFEERYASGADPRDSAFWRAVRQEALNPSIDPSANPGERLPRTGLLFQEDDGMRPVVACRLEQIVPDGFEVLPFDDPVTWPAYVAGLGGDLEAASRAAFDPDGHLLPLGTRRLIAQGVLVLRQFASGQYEVASGAEVHGCRRALVAQSLAQAFIDAFSGATGVARTQPSFVEGWVEVDGCEVRQVDDLPRGLEGVTQLLRTMSPPSVALFGGVRVPGGFLFVPAFLPAVHAPEVRAVDVIFGDGTPNAACSSDTSRQGVWLLPAVANLMGAVSLRASWSIPTNGGVVARSGDTSLSFVEHVVADDYRGKPRGHHFVESCPDPEVDVRQSEDVPLGIAIASSERSGDVVDLESSARFLGPGFGEMALERRPGFDWLVVGNKKHPELLIYVGDSSHPIPPAQRRSTSKGDRKHWKKGFEAKRRFARISGQFIPLEDAPEAVRHAYDQYRRHNVLDGMECPETSLETLVETPIPRVDPSEATAQAVDVLAALACRRAGLTWADVREVFQALLDDDDPIHFQQVLRGWSEAGLVDLLREARMSRLLIVPRQPRFVMVRRGPDVEATLVGLVTSVRRRRVDRAVAQVGRLGIRELRPANPWQPSTLRLRCSVEEVERIRCEAELSASEWLDWPEVSQRPACLDIASARSRLTRTAPPDAYKFDASWDWARTCFYRGFRSGESIQLERRLHVDSSAIYVLAREGQPLMWTHSRGWALLEGYALRGVAPFRAERGVLSTTGRAPVHLPLPVGRLCVLIGEALPGPARIANVIRYSYPFGLRLFSLVEQVLPAEWLVGPKQSSVGV